ncbi:MAG: peptidoglycan DD-metalloendopeptidase family protein [Clostridia bacterium]|nr:peptidoglycan DD-metalloendopeptidase family protein [Clostridia bacterium]
MSRKIKRLFMMLCAVTVVSFVIVGKLMYESVTVIANTANSSKTIYELETKLDSIKSERSDLEKQIASDKGKISSLEKEIKGLDEEISILTAQSYIISQLYNEWLAVSEQTKLEMQTLDKQKQYELEAFDSMLRMAYMHGDDTYFEMIFGSEDIGDFLSRADMLAYHFQANDNVLTNLTSTIGSLENALSQYNESLEKLGNFEQQQEEIKQTLEERSASASQKKSELQSNVKENQKQLSAKQSEMAQMEADLKALYEQQKAQDSPPAYTGTGVFCIPTTNYRITSEFSYRISPITGKPESHNGLDMAAPSGTPIYAADNGTVIDSRYSSSWGNVVQIDHGGGLVTLYAHCSARLVSKGQTVKRGETIALVGTTGWSTGNHLHFTVYKNGVAVNPRNYLPL